MTSLKTSIKTITYLSDIGCLEIQGASLMGMNIINDDITGRVHKDRKVLTGDSPFAANALGKLAAQEMLAAYAG
ncbi:hypothetical protein VEE56_17040 [Escherichia coli]|nr:hypothetical protein VEE56_17040 [Escherichia coli]